MLTVGLAMIFCSLIVGWAAERCVGGGRARLVASWRSLLFVAIVGYSTLAATCAYMQMKMSIEPEVCMRVQKAATADKRAHFVLRRPTRRNKLHIGALLNYRKSRATRPSRQRPPTISIDASSPIRLRAATTPSPAPIARSNCRAPSRSRRASFMPPVTSK